MSKFIIIFCFAFAASVTNDATLKKSKQQKIADDQCIEDINTTYGHLIDEYRAIHEHNDEKKFIVGLIKFLVKATSAFEEVSEKVRQTKTIDTMEKKSIIPGYSISCNEDIVEAVNEIVSTLSDRFLKESD